MNIAKILAKVGSSLIKSVIPGAGLVIDAVNAFLPTDKKLPSDATGIQAMEAINSLPPKEQAEVLSKQCDVEIAEIQGWTDVVKALSDADKSGSSTRPFIASLMAWAVFLSIMMLNSAIAYAIVANKAEIIGMVAKTWPLVSAMLGIPSLVLQYYFGKRTEDKKMRANAALGLPTIQAGGLLSSLIKKVV